MHTGQGRPESRFLVASLIFSCLIGGTSTRVHGQSLAKIRPICLKVQVNQCQHVLPTPRADEKYFLILGSLSMNSGPYRVSIQTEAIEAKDEGHGMKDEKGKAVDSDSRFPSSAIVHRSLTPKDKSLPASA